MSTLIITPHTRFQAVLAELFAALLRVAGAGIAHRTIAPETDWAAAAAHPATQPLANAWDEDEPDYDPANSLWVNPSYRHPVNRAI